MDQDHELQYLSEIWALKFEVERLQKRNRQLSIRVVHLATKLTCDHEAWLDDHEDSLPTIEETRMFES